MKQPDAGLAVHDDFKHGRATLHLSLLISAYLLARWNAGCHTAMRLFRELRQRGYGGSYGVVAAYAHRLRQAQGLPPGHRRPRQALPAVAEPACPPLTPRRATWLVLRRETKRTETEAYMAISGKRYMLLRTHAWDEQVIERLREELR